MKHNKSTNKSCIKNNCKDEKSINIKNILVAPFDDLPKDMQRLLSYFLHSAPNIESVHSQKIPAEKHSVIFEKMMDSRHFYYKGFCNFNARIEKELQKANLNGESLCLKCKRFICKRKKPDQYNPVETDLECFLRHIRNAIAHGRVYYQHRGNRVHIVFEDYNQSKNLSARIVCIKADLEYWKKVLQNPNK